jgi:pimeloyl-ACP methyl ester carboxylesterase
MKIYTISGLGADKRVFNALTLNDEIVHLDWIPPLKEEGLRDYAIRLFKPCEPQRPFAIMGVSFGGMIASEISKEYNPDLSILISSVETKNELGPSIKAFSKFNFIRFVPPFMFRIPRFVAKHLFGARNTSLLYQILDDSDLVFTKWAIEAIIRWDNNHTLQNSVLICGEKDKIIPPSKAPKAIVIKGGQHFMIVDQAEEISEIINDCLKEIK